MTLFGLKFDSRAIMTCELLGYGIIINNADTKINVTHHPTHSEYNASST
jgi:hypothetical protein